jgi:hypothetical protein
VFGNTDDLVDGQIGLDRAKPFADLIRLISLEPMQSQFVLLGIDRNGLQTELVGSPENPDCNFRPVRNENFSYRQTPTPPNNPQHARHISARFLLTSKPIEKGQHACPFSRK